LKEAGAEFLVVGAHALAVHGVPRATGDLDIWIRPDPENARKVWKALLDFGAPVETMGLTLDDLSRPGIVFQMGLPPRRIDLLTEIDGVSFGQAWPSQVVEKVGDLEVPFLGREALLQNKKASARPKDLADVSLLEGTGEK
jgi:glycine cleavage system aminomethyltransferase T